MNFTCNVDKKSKETVYTWMSCKMNALLDDKNNQKQAINSMPRLSVTQIDTYDTYLKFAHKLFQTYANICKYMQIYGLNEQKNIWHGQKKISKIK